MKFILQILLSLFTIFFVNISETVFCKTLDASEIAGFVFYQANSEYQQANIFFESAANNSCLNEKVVVTYSERVTGKDANLAKGGRSLRELHGSIDEWVKLQRQLANSNTQLREFNTATIVYNKATGKYYYGSNRGIAFKENELHSMLAKNLPEESLNNYKLGNCAECDAVNQALHDGAGWNDLQMHTVGVEWKTGNIFTKPLCTNCEFTFNGIEIIK